MRLPSDWPEGFTLRLGKVAILFAQIEFLLKLYVKQFLGDFQRGMIVTSRMQFNQLLELTTSLAKREIRDAALKRGFLELVIFAGKVQDKRNAYFHSAWGMSDDGSPVTIGYQRTRTNQQPNGIGLVKTRNVVSEPDLDDLIRALDDVKSKLSDLRPLIWPELRPKRIKRKRTF
ncbi:MAG TPA: hypothetical protein VFE34_07410 [Dongiaceae bacterium]|jgi:hypothetical protein|nr:hypothetical protein [Dongiaceae bacterium]